MRRKVFDVPASGSGALVTVVLVVAGALFMWGYSSTNSSVHNQLAVPEMPYHGVYALISTAARTATSGSAAAAKLTALDGTSFQARRSEACCSGRGPSRRSAPSPCGPASPRSSWPS